MMKRKLSLTLRLTFFYMATSCLVLLAFSWVVILAIQHHFDAQDQQSLIGKLKLVESIVSNVTLSNDGYVPLAVKLNSVLVGHKKLQLLISTTDRQVLYRSSGLALPLDKIDTNLTPNISKTFDWREGEKSFLGISAILEYSAQPYIVTLILNKGFHEKFMPPFKRKLLFYTAIAALISWLLGWLVSRRGLLPLYLIKDKALEVTANRLDQRIPENNVPVEIFGLVVALNQMLERLDFAFTRLTQFTNEIAHELCTPVSNLMTQTQVIISKPRDTATYRNTLESNVEEYQKMSSMLTDMLFLAKADHKIGFAKEEFINLGKEAGELFEFYEALVEEQQIVFTLSDRSAGAAIISGDKSMIRRAISNLLSNAIRHTAEQGKINMVIETTSQFNSFSVINTGSRIPSSVLPYIFDRFYSATHSKVSEKSAEGTGLGLAITQAIVQAHQGEINVTSTHNRTCFQLKFNKLSTSDITT